MGPFVPDLITEELNLVVALVLGFGFGFVLEQAGFSSSRRLAGVFYGYDFTVLRVFFTAAITAMCGVLLLGNAGLLDTGAIFVNPTWLLPAIVGGAVMGIGFILGGYCPGTSLCAAAIGKIDAMWFILGGVLGVFAYGELYPLFMAFADSTALGAIMVYESLGMPQGAFAAALIAAAVGAFVLTTLIERRVAGPQAPSSLFRSRPHVVAGALAVALGLALGLMPDRKARLLDLVADPGFVVAHPSRVMDADELAFRIIDREPNIAIIDTRPPAAFAGLALPGSKNVPMEGFFGKEWASTLSRRHVTKVVVAETEEQGRSAGLLLEELGYENVSVLQGGIGKFRRMILSPPSLASAGARSDPEVVRFREEARAAILKMIAAEKARGAPAVKLVKKIQGGC